MSEGSNPEDAMSITITDPAFLKRLVYMRGRVVLNGPTGTTIGRINTRWPEPVPPWGRFQFVDHLFDSDLLGEFTRVREPVELFDPRGNRFGRFEPACLAKSLPGLRCPYTDEDLEWRRNEAGRGKGHTLAEVWKIIYEKYVGDDVEPLIVQWREPGC